MWRTLLPSGEIIPSRRDLRPAVAKEYLRDLVLAEICLTERKTRIRLIGSGLDLRWRQNVSGLDYLEGFPEAYREGAWLAAVLMVTTPCGLWQVSRVHFDNGESCLHELTMLPLSADADGWPMTLSLIDPIELPSGGTEAPRATRIDTALTFSFLDIGAGLPAWTG